MKAAEKKPVGRPPLVPGSKKDAVMIVRLAPEEKAAIEAAAEHEGETASAWVRRILLDAAERALTEGEEPPEPSGSA